MSETNDDRMKYSPHRIDSSAHTTDGATADSLNEHLARIRELEADCLMWKNSHADAQAEVERLREAIDQKAGEFSGEVWTGAYGRMLHTVSANRDTANSLLREGLDMMKEPQFWMHPPFYNWRAATEKHLKDTPGDET